MSTPDEFKNSPGNSGAVLLLACAAVVVTAAGAAALAALRWWRCGVIAAGSGGLFWLLLQVALRGIGHVPSRARRVLAAAVLVASARSRCFEVDARAPGNACSRRETRAYSARGPGPGPGASRAQDRAHCGALAGAVLVAAMVAVRTI
jgi:hypothetical protein